MNEIEIKAHVRNRNDVVKNLSGFAKYSGDVVRDDEYYANELNPSIKIRLRKETVESEGSSKTINLITYKKKEQKSGADGIEIEVNDEKECSISDSAPLKSFLEDSGYKIVLKKHKEVSDWCYDLGFVEEADCRLTATLELCNVPPLGDFLEVEILSPVRTTEAIDAIRKKLEQLIEMAGIEKKDIENRYYSQMLKEAKQNV